MEFVHALLVTLVILWLAFMASVGIMFVAAAPLILYYDKIADDPTMQTTDDESMT